ncbi:hypothetical protein NAPIS_ORF01160 [Vairimorpha apis BRL 01]|uniref:Peptidase C19 ubiquitin carboxyl-terminal hydrolase domain-containing protein n=1 Tax=Vairimorpha apis BRL 01 TaxID=1037528 RepID=T0LA30_9MICR|nr:hypothetical protein NAPIS_ORF01160 [Vairimorpha apis BRL 01]
MLLFLNLIIINTSNETSDSLSEIPRFRNDSINCYGNSLFQCLNNIKRLNYFLKTNFRFPVYKELSDMFQKMKKFDYNVYFLKNHNTKDIEYDKKSKEPYTTNFYENFLFKNNSIDSVLDFSNHYNFLINFINIKGLNTGEENDPIEFLEFLLQKCYTHDFYNETSFYDDFKIEFDGHLMNILNFPISNIQNELNEFFQYKPIRYFPKIAVIRFFYQPGNENKSCLILKSIYIKNQKYSLNSLIINQRGFYGHFYAILNVNGVYFKADNEFVEKIDFLDERKGVYALFYEME